MSSQPAGNIAKYLDVGYGRARRDGTDNLIVGRTPGEWSVLGRSGQEPALLSALEGSALEGVDAGAFTTLVEVTHTYVLTRLIGDKARAVLSKLCAMELSARAAPNGTAFQAPLAGLAVGLVRDDTGGETSFLCYCERSSGQYLFDCFMSAGGEFGIDIDGYPEKEI